jgi:hypothetical protein
MTHHMIDYRRLMIGLEVRPTTACQTLQNADQYRAHGATPQYPIECGCSGQYVKRNQKDHLKSGRHQQLRNYSLAHLLSPK